MTLDWYPKVKWLTGGFSFLWRKPELLVHFGNTHSDMVSATTLLLKLETGRNLKALQIEDPHLWLIDKHIPESSMLSTKSKWVAITF